MPMVTSDVEISAAFSILSVDPAMPAINPPKSCVMLHRIHFHPTSSPPSAATTATSAVLRHTPPSASPSAAVELEVSDEVAGYHAHAVGGHQSCSAVVQEICAPVDTIWSVVRRFDAPQVYKHFVRSCDVISGDGDVGTLRRVRVVSGLPAAVSDERLEILDDRRHVISFSVVGGDHRLSNYRSVTSLHPTDQGITTVVESYVVDTPAGNTKEETCVFVDTIVRCNLQSLAQIAENLARRERREKINDDNDDSTAS
ncbi:hypothetical protein Cgig2_017192 [Carnegiea gigantea]|uniref:Abscisic acid receptor PYL4 n=1 Tax=Carnegiea gigantea TaxID=171969 RepID=A0A9Q1JTZ8_9CARY|nr:hypothetical protein Cgig2_017192 [Carnegiea gigantea]